MILYKQVSVICAIGISKQNAIKSNLGTSLKLLNYWEMPLGIYLGKKYGLERAIQKDFMFKFYNL